MPGADPPAKAAIAGSGMYRQETTFGLEISMKSTKQAIENMEYVRRLLEQKQPGFAASLEFAASLVEASLERTDGRTDPADLTDLEATDSRQGHSAGLDVVEAQKMEPIPAREVICTGSLVHNWRVAQLTRLGIPRPLAEAVAADVDWHQVAALVRRGCPPRLALHIVR
jgi:hypothetical protein